MAHFPPGPNDRLLGLRTMSRIKSDVLGSYAALQRDHGDSVSFRTGPFRLFLFFHPEQVREVLVQSAKSFIRMPRVMRTFSQWNGNSILIAEGAPWTRQRRLVQPAFQPRRLEGYGQTMVAKARSLLDSWRPTIDRDGHIDVDTDQAMTALTLEIICKTLFDADATDASGDIARAVAVLSEVAFHEMQAPLRLPIWLPTRFNRRKRWAMGVLDQTIWRILRARRAEGRDHYDVLSMLLAAVDDDDGRRLDDRQVRDEAMTLMLAGHDTTAAGLDWLWYNLACHPDVARTCRDEIETVLGGREPRAQDTAQLTYLEATIRESLRLYPPAIGVFLRQATADLVVGGYDVPRGSLVTVSSYVTHRDRRWFPEPEQFRPERFLKPHLDEIPAGAYFPFGAGPRVCVGQSFAVTEMMLIAATLLKECTVQPVPEMPAPTPHVHMALRPKQKLMLRWQRASPLPATRTVAN